MGGLSMGFVGVSFNMGVGHRLGGTARPPAETLASWGYGAVFHSTEACAILFSHVS